MNVIDPVLHTSDFKNYWEKGTGSLLLEWAQAEPRKEEVEALRPLHQEVDTLGDQVVHKTFLAYPYAKASALIEKHKRGDDFDSSERIPELEELLKILEETPDWYDASLGEKGAELCQRAGVTSLMALRDYSLMGGYDFAYLNKPLIYTGALKKGAVKRLKDTLEFWIQVTRTGGLEPKGEGRELILRTRLMHSYSRLKIKENVKEWNYALWGEPINMLDMCATYLGFSAFFLHGIERLGITPTESEEKGLFHLWKLIGHLLGIPSELLPEDRKKAVELFYLWSLVQRKGDRDSKTLAQALLQENLESTIYPYLFQRKLLLGLHKTISHELLDSEVLERLGVDRAPFLNFFPHLLRFKNYSEQRLSSKNFKTLIRKGNKEQLKVLQDYLTHTPNSSHG